jgi:hypothetical protein
MSEPDKLIATIHVDGSFVYVEWHVPAPNKCHMRVFAILPPSDITEPPPEPRQRPLIDPRRAIGANTTMPPIKPENVARYPANWARIRTAILERAGHRCEWPGCGVRNHATGYWDRETFVEVAPGVIDSGDAVLLAIDGHRLLRIVLTVAHLDHTPENCEPENLRAWCQRHHLRHDLDHHISSAYMTRHARAGTQELF